jgi:hypothetical protein
MWVGECADFSHKSSTTIITTIITIIITITIIAKACGLIQSVQ